MIDKETNQKEKKRVTPRISTWCHHHKLKRVAIISPFCFPLNIISPFLCFTLVVLIILLPLLLLLFFIFYYIFLIQKHKTTYKMLHPQEPHNSQTTKFTIGIRNEENQPSTAIGIRNEENDWIHVFKLKGVSKQHCFWFSFITILPKRTEKKERRTETKPNQFIWREITD